MSRPLYKLMDVIPHLDAAAFTFGEIIDGDSLLKIVNRQYGERYIIDSDTSPSLSTPETAAAVFTDEFAGFQARRGENYKRLYDMILMEYNPIENYDRLEEGAYSDTTTAGERKRSTEDNRANTSTSTPRVQMTTETYGAGFNSAEPVLTGKSVASTNASEDVNDVIKTQNSGGETSTEEAYTDTTKRTFDGYRIHGNIGVTTTAQMMEGELAMRRRLDLAALVIDEFMCEVSFYC